MGKAERWMIMSSQLLLGSEVCLAAGLFCLLAKKLNWEITDEASGQPIPHVKGACNCFAWGAILFLVSLLTAKVPLANTAVAVSVHCVGLVEATLENILLGLLVLWFGVWVVGGIAYTIFNACQDAWEHGGRAKLLAIGFLLSILVTLAGLTFNPSLDFPGRALAQVWFRLWHLTALTF